MLSNSKEAAMGETTARRTGQMVYNANYHFGKKLKAACEKTGHNYQGQQITKDIKGTKLLKGDYFYIDHLHNNHIESF